MPFDEFELHLFASDRGLMATPTRCTIYAVDAQLLPWNAALPAASRPRSFSITSGPDGSSCPGQVRPFHPRLVAGTSNPGAGAFSAFSLQLDRDDGDQYLGDLNFKMPPGFTGDLRGITYCPEAAIAAAARRSGATSRRRRAARLESQIGTTNVAAGPGGPPLPRGRQDVPRRAVQGRAAEPGRDHPGARRPLRLRHGRGPGRAPGRPARRPGDAPSPTPCPRSSAGCRSGCARSRSASTGRTS